MRLVKLFRKFGLEYSDLPTMVSNINTLLRIVLINIDGRNTRPIPIIVYVTTLIATVCYGYAYVFSMFWFVVAKCRPAGDLVAASVVLSSGISSEIGIVKLMFFGYYQGRLRYIVSQYLKHNSEAMGSRFSRNLNRALRSVKKRAIIYWVLIVASGVAYVVKPFFLSGRHLSHDSYIIYGLEPILESPNFEIASVIMAIGVFFASYTAASITGFVVLIVGYTEAQMLALSEELLHLWRDAVDNYHEINNTSAISQDVIVNKYINKHLIHIISRHSVNIDLINQVEAVFKVPIAVGFLLLSLGIVGELIGGLQNTYLTLSFALVQLGMDCYIGQKVMDASLEFAQATYNCNWENFDSSNMKIVLMVLQNSQKAMVLSAGGLTKLNFYSLMAILKSIYSSYTALNSFMRSPPS